jgi:hypothetical protein
MLFSRDCNRTESEAQPAARHFPARLDGNDNDGGAVATIIRQSSGKGLFAQYDGQ